ncbi:MAG TPA: polysaccharide biosynthesis C-terminal domain-containing protein, partial [Bacillota bacterium]
SQVYEQIVRIVTIIASAILLLPYGIPWAAAGANFGAVSGAVVALVYLMALYGRYRTTLAPREHQARWRPRRRRRDIIAEVLGLAVPISLAGLAFPLFGLVDLLFMPMRLQAAGFSAEEATTAYGALTQQAAPFINIPLSFTTGFALALVPAVAEAAAVRQLERVRRLTGTALRIALLIALPAVAGLMVLARDLTTVLFDYPEAGGPLFVLAMAAVFIGVQQMSSGVLQGLGQPMVPVRNLFAGVATKAVLTWTLAVWPGWEVEGVALATVIGFAVSGLLNLVSVWRRAGGLGLTLGDLTRMVAAAAVMGTLVHLARPLLPAVTGPSLPGLLTVGTLVALGIVVYGLAALRFGGVTSQDFEHFRRLEPLARRLRAWGLLR